MESCAILVAQRFPAVDVWARALRPRAHTSAAGDILCATIIAQDSSYLLPIFRRKQSCLPEFDAMLPLESRIMPWCRVATPHDVTGSAAMAARLAACRGRSPPHTERASNRPLTKEVGFRLQGAAVLPLPREGRFPPYRQRGWSQHPAPRAGRAPG